MCFRGCRGEGDEGGGTDDGQRGAGRGCCCDDLERYQRVARESERERKERKRRTNGKAVEAKREEARDEGLRRGRAGSEGCGCRDVSVEMRREE